MSATIGGPQEIRQSVKVRSHRMRCRAALQHPTLQRITRDVNHP